MGVLKRRPEWHQTRPAAEFEGHGMGPAHYFVVRCKGTFQEFRYQVVTDYVSVLTDMGLT